MTVATTSKDTQLYVRILDNVNEGVVAIDRDGDIAFLNPAAQSFSGISEKQALGRPFEKLFSGQKELLHLLKTAIKGGRSISNHENVQLIQTSGNSLPVSISVSPIYTRAGEQEGAVLIIRDLSRIRDLESAVRRADRLSMLGTLAAGLAHEIKNPLGGIKGAVQLMDLELSEDSPLREYTGVMIREVERVNHIIEELMDLARPRPPKITEVNLSKILRDIVLFQKEAQHEKKIDFQLNIDPSIPPILGDKNLLHRLFLNLIKNAGESIKSEGRVEIITKIVSDYHMNKPGSRPVPFVVIKIKDNGQGIPQSEIDQIFTPFYTTKNHGTGLGLATCQKIVSEHNGFLKVESTLGKGTVFSVSLPFQR